MAQRLPQTSTLEEKIQKGCFWIIVVSLSLSTVGFGAGAILPSRGPAVPKNAARIGEITYVLLKTMTTVAQDQILQTGGLTEFDKWNPEHDHIGDTPLQAMQLASIASRLNVKNVCQVYSGAPETLV